MPTSFKLHTPSLWGRFPVINLWSASPIGDNSHQGFFCSSLHSHRRRYSTVYTGTVVLLALSKLCFMCKISGDGAPFSSIVAITTFKRSLSQLAFHLVFKIFMWHPNSGDILLHILEAYSENHMKMFAWFLQSVLSRLEKDCNSWFCSRSHSKTKVWVHPNPQPFYLWGISLSILSLSLEPTLFCPDCKDNPPLSALGGTLAALQTSGAGQALMCVWSCPEWKGRLW